MPTLASDQTATLNEHHALGAAPKGSIAIDPEQPAQLVPYSDEQPVLGTGLNQQFLNNRHHCCQRMSPAILLKSPSIKDQS